MQQISIGLDGKTIAALDDALREMNSSVAEEDGAPAWTRSLAIRSAVRRWLAERRPRTKQRK